MKDSIKDRENMEFYLNSNESIKSDSVLVPLDVIRPSEYDGFTLEEETNLRFFGCELIQEGGVMLKLPQVTMITGMELFHRFFFRRSFSRTNLQNSVAACLFLATKLEETPKKVRDVVSVFDYLLKIKRNIAPPIPVLDLNSNEFLRLRQELFETERLILKEIGFSLTHLAIKPYKYLYYYAKILKLNRLFTQKAWNYINDAYRITVCVSFPPHVLAATAIYLTSHVLNVPLPEVEWWVAFDCKFSDIEEVASEILMLYQMRKVTFDYVNDTIRRHTVEENKDVTMEAAVPEESEDKKIHARDETPEANKKRTKEKTKEDRSDERNGRYKRSKYRRSRSRSRSPYRKYKRHDRHRSSHKNSSRRHRRDKESHSRQEESDESS